MTHIVIKSGMIYDKDCENDPNIKYKIDISNYYYSVLRIIMLELKRLRVILLKKNKTKPKYFDHHHFFSSAYRYLVLSVPMLSEES